MAVKETSTLPGKPDVHRPAMAHAWLILSVPVILALAVATRIGHLESGPHFDELYHLYAARGWLETGEFRILDGIYDRAALYTRLVAAAIEGLGNELELVRLTSVALGCALVLAIYLWLGLASGVVAATVAAFLAILWPDGIITSQMLRFYTPHGLLFFLGAAGIFHLATAPSAWGRSLPVAAGTLVCLALAAHLQPITFIGLAGIACWFGLFVVLPFILAHPRRWILLGAAVGLGVAVAAFAVTQGYLDAAWERFRWVPLWAEHRRDFEAYYFNEFLAGYPALWPFLPLAIILACAHRPRLGAFCATVFLVGLALHSLGGMKHLRYVYWLMPFWFMVVGLAVAAVAAPLGRALSGAALYAVRGVAPALGTPALASLVAAVALAFAVGVNPAFREAVVLAAGKGQTQIEIADWSLAAPVLEPLTGEDVVVATSSDLKALHFLGDVDVVVNASRLSEIPDRSEFARDPRTGLPVISTPASLARVVACTPQGLFVTSRFFWDENALFQTATGDLSGTRITEVSLPDAANLVAAEWTTATVDAAACAGTDALVRPVTRH